jgi:polyisoprenyl-phosphate glycosyltransferase
MMAIRPRILLTVVIPCYNEEESLPHLLQQLMPHLEEATGSAWEVILVDDGSLDRTAEIIRETHQAESRVRGVVLSRNFGHQAAIFAGLAYASGDYIGVMDADLQDPPRVLIQCFQKARNEQFDLIYAVRKRRRANPLLKAAYWAFYRAMNALAEYHWPLDAGDLSVFSRKALRLIMQLPEHVRVLRGLRSWVGLKQGSVEYDRPQRGKGDSKYSLFKLGTLALNALISFSNVPLRLASVLGLAMSALSFTLSVAFLLNRLFPQFSIFGYYIGANPGTATIVILLMIFGGLLFLCLGILGEYLAIVVKEIKRRPVAIVHHHYGIKDANPQSPLILVTQHRDEV